MNRNILSIRTRLIVAAFAFLLSGTLIAEPYPLEYWALRDVVSSVSLSPDGDRVALMKIATRDANPTLEVYDAADFDKKPFRFGADKMEIVNYFWVGDQDIVVTFRQKARDKIEGFNQGVYEYRLALVDVDKREIDQFREVGPQVEHLLPNDPNKIIISFNPSGRDKSMDKLDRAFRPRAYHKLDLESNKSSLLMQGKLSMGNIDFDGDGNPRVARGFDRGSDELVWYAKKPGSDDWIEFNRMHEDSFEAFEFAVLGWDENNPSILFVRAHNGKDKAGLWEFNIDTKSFGELIYARNDVNVAGVRMHSNYWTNPDTVAGVAYSTDKLHVEYFDAVEGATIAQLEGLVPAAYNVRITSRSRDGQTLIVYNSGPRDPGTYYLIKDGAMKTIGSRQPLLKSEDLADVKYVSWKARDGREIFGYMTVPKGEPPFPLIVLPHGGPFVSETVSWDEWGQMLANNGYLVLQPQYRGSTNFGLEYYQSAFMDGGQGGYKMQDDKDDGAMYLVEQGMADKDRIALFGWSYGGYAALVAASRTPQIHQCVIAGAAVSDTLMQVGYYSDRMRGAQEMEQTKMWKDSVNPIDEVEKVNVPMLLIHGSVDQRVPPAHVRKYLRKMDDYNKPYKYVELDGADHFSNTLFYDHQILLYESMIDFLKTDCGPGGL